MADTATLNTLGEIERAATLPDLLRLLNELVDPADLVPYSEAFGHQPRFEPFGDVRDALERISIDRGATDQFARDVAIGALIRVVVAQQKQLDELRQGSLGSLEPKGAKSSASSAAK
jgi:hypothetical protein